MTFKVAAITGAYGGLGTALSKALAERGYKLVLGDLNKSELDSLVSEIGDLTEAIPVVVDVRSKRACDNFINSAVSKFGRVDLLINCAGVWRKSAIEDITEQEVRDIFEVNVFGAIYCSQAAAKVMKAQKSGHILNIGSTTVIKRKTSHIAYGSSKAALVGFTSFLRTELEGTGIRASIFSPGGIKTKLFHTNPDRNIDHFMEPEFVAEKMLQHIENVDDDWHVILRRPNSG